MIVWLCVTLLAGAVTGIVCRVFVLAALAPVIGLVGVAIGWRDGVIEVLWFACGGLIALQAGYLAGLGTQAIVTLARVRRRAATRRATPVAIES
jgi:hypothetical protein